VEIGGGGKMKSDIPWHEKPAVRVREGAELLGIGSTKTYQLLKDGRLEAIKIDERTLISVASIKRLLADAPKGVGLRPRERSAEGNRP
jgi:excisionase family DNA binding protein